MSTTSAASGLLPGKLPPALLSALLDSFGPLPDDVRLGPAVGEDACALDVGDRIVVAATDPITLTGSDVGRYAVIVNANDVAVSGARPRWFLATVLLPLGTDAELVETVFESMREALDGVGATLVGGHTEITGAVTQPVVVGQMLGVVDDGRLRTTSGAAPNDIVVQVGAVPVEGAAVLAAEAAGRLTAVPADVLASAAGAVREPGISVVEAALAAHDLGATAMHDPTEGGLAAGLHELADAARAAVRVDADSIHWFEPGVRVCRELGADPLSTLASGALLATFPPEAAQRAVGELRRRGHYATVVGVVETGAGVSYDDGLPVPRPDRDEVARILEP